MIYIAAVAEEDALITTIRQLNIALGLVLFTNVRCLSRLKFTYLMAPKDSPFFFLGDTNKLQDHFRDQL